MIDNTTARQFIEAFNAVAFDVHMNAVSKGFWPDLGRTEEETKGYIFGAKYALMVSELSKALEKLRKPGPDQHCTRHPGEAVELADCIIRIMDYAAARHLNIAEALVAKAEYNCQREHKHGGKVI